MAELQKAQDIDEPRKKSGHRVSTTVHLLRPEIHMMDGEGGSCGRQPVIGPEEGPHTAQTTPGLGRQSTQDQRRKGLAW